MLTFLIASALAAPPAHYDPDRVAAASTIFRGFSEKAAPKFDLLQTELSRTSKSTAALDKGMLALGDRTSADQQERVTQIRRETAHGFLVAQAWVDTLQEDSAKTFGAAMDRALATQAAKFDLKECTRPRGMAAMGPARQGPGATCEGEDVSSTISAALDEDAVLASEVQDILAVPWPGLSSAPGAQSVVALTGTSAHLHMGALLDALAPGEFESLGKALGAQQAPLQAKLEEGENVEDNLQALQDLRSGYEQDVAALGARLLAAIEPTLEKQGGSIGVCANPPVLGGCAGEDLTGSLVAELAENRKVQKRLR
jgi:hypothetical protein